MPTLEQAGVILDWDGVVVDSARLHDESWSRLARESGFTLPPGYFIRSFGKKGDAIVREVLRWTADPREAARLAAMKEEFYREILAQSDVHALPGVLGFLSMLEQAGVSVAIGSSTDRANIETVFPRLQLPGLWRGIISAENVERGKPEPEVFLKAAGLLGKEPRNCIVVEDAIVGFQAARRAQMKVIGVATTLPLRALVPHVDLAVENLASVTLARIEGLHAASAKL